MPIDPNDFVIGWQPARKGIQFVTVTHTPSGKRIELKAAKCVTDTWLASDNPQQARNQWLRATAVTHFTRLFYEKSPEGKREALFAEARQHKTNVLDAQEFCERLRADYPAQAHRIPTITIEGGEG